MIHESDSGTRFASPASSVAGDSDSDIPPWEKFEEELYWETEYCESQWRLAPAEDSVPAMPCTQ
eukprot:100368-Heterocapsa_arctica.AAC.1